MHQGKLSFNEWFPTWPKASNYEYWAKSQGTGLKRAHELMGQANKAYEKYLNQKMKRMRTIEELKDLAYRAFCGTSFSPEKRGEQFTKEHGELLADDLLSVPEEEKESYTDKFISLCSAYLSSHSNVYSTMIAGPSNFPVRRMQKLSRWADNKYAALSEWRNSYFKALEKKKKVAAVEAAGGELEMARKHLAQMKKDHELMKKTNAILRKKGDDEEKKKAILEIGWPDDVLASIFNLKGHNWWGTGFAGFELTNSNARIKNTEQRVKTLEARETSEAKHYECKDGIKITLNNPENRLEVYFPGKPEREIINELKHNGFRWTPSKGCWQSYINHNSRNYVMKFEPKKIESEALSSQTA